MKDIGELLRQAQQMQSKMTSMQEELAGKLVQGSSGGGMVRVTANGKQEIVSVSIDKAVVDPQDVEMLQDLITAGVNDALRQARELAQQEMASLAGGFHIPGLM